MKPRRSASARLRTRAWAIAAAMCGDHRARQLLGKRRPADLGWHQDGAANRVSPGIGFAANPSSSNARAGAPPRPNLPAGPAISAQGNGGQARFVYWGDAHLARSGHQGRTSISAFQPTAMRQVRRHHAASVWVKSPSWGRSSFQRVDFKPAPKALCELGLMAAPPCSNFIHHLRGHFPGRGPTRLGRDAVISGQRQALACYQRRDRAALPGPASQIDTSSNRPNANPPGGFVSVPFCGPRPLAMRPPSGPGALASADRRASKNWWGGRTLKHGAFSLRFGLTGCFTGIRGIRLGEYWTDFSFARFCFFFPGGGGGEKTPPRPSSILVTPYRIGMLSRLPFWPLTCKWRPSAGKPVRGAFTWWVWFRRSGCA